LFLLNTGRIFFMHFLLSIIKKKKHDPKLVRELFDNCAGETAIIIASRYQESAVYHIGASNQAKKQAGKQTFYQHTLF